MAERYGQYELLEKFAEGGAAELYFARLRGREGFTRELAIKRLLPGYTERTDLVEMFLDEARLAASLLHPNVVQVFDLGEINGSFFMAMELVDGPHLGRMFSHSLRIDRALPVEFCAWILSRAAEGLHYAHERVDPLSGESLAIVHRDVSPHNILVSRYGDVKLTDFGIARAKIHRAVTRVGVVKGKSAYLSPEQCRGEAFNRRADVFCLGIVLYELITRRRLYREASTARARERIIGEEPLPPSVLNPEVDAVLGEIALRALRKDPRHRYQTAAEFGDALQAWLGSRNSGDVRSALSYWMSQHTAAIWTTAEVRAKRWQGQQAPVESKRMSSPQVTRHAGGSDQAVFELREESLGLHPRRTNLPRERGSFFGRAAEVRRLQRLFSSGDRLITIVGTAGIGKSRLARHFGHRLSHELGESGGVWLCDVAEHETAEGLCLAVAGALAIPLVGEGGEGSERQLARALAGRGRSLLIVDNFDRMAQHPVEVLRVWLRMAPELTVLVTSRARLKEARDGFVDVPPLDVPSAGGRAQGDAVALFLDRARLVRPDWQPDEQDAKAVVEIVRQLDGLPLALELAAARLADLEPIELLQRLSHRFEVLRAARSGKTPGQGATLRGAIDWSWTLLKTDERRSLAALSVCRGGFSLPAAVEIVGEVVARGRDPVAVVTALRDRSLLYVVDRGADLATPRFALLRSIGAYANEKLADPDRERANLRHAGHYADTCSGWAVAALGHGGSEPYGRLALETENLLIAHERCLAATPLTARHLDLARRAALALCPVLERRGPWDLLARALEAAATGQAKSADRRLEAAVGVARSRVVRHMGSPGEARRCAEEALVVARDLADDRLQGRALHQLAGAALNQSRLDEARAFVSQALDTLRAEGDLRHAGLALRRLAQIDLACGDDVAAFQRFEQAQDVLRSAGDRHAEAETEARIGSALAARGRLNDAATHLQRGLEIFRQVSSLHGEGLVLAHLGPLFALRGNHDRAREELNVAIERLVGVGDHATAALARSRLAVVRWLQGRLRDAGELAEAAAEAARELGDRALIARSVALHGAIQAASDDRSEATRTFERAMGWSQADDPPELAAAIHVCIAQLDLAGARAARAAGDAQGLARRLDRADERVVAVLDAELDAALEDMPSLDLRLLVAAWRVTRRSAAGEDQYE